MGSRTIQIDAQVEEFAQRVRQHYADAKVFMFGSRARGDHLKSSDYDFIIVSKQFQGVHFLDRITTVLRQCRVDFAAEILCYTPDEFEKKKKQIGTVQSAMKDAVPI